MIRHHRLARTICLAILATTLLLMSAPVVASAVPMVVPVTGSTGASATASPDLVGSLEPLIPEALRAPAAPLVDMLRRATSSSDGYVGIAKLSLLIGFATVVLRMVSRTIVTVVQLVSKTVLTIGRH